MTEQDFNKMFVYYKRDNVQIKTKTQLDYYEVLMDAVSINYISKDWAIQSFLEDIKFINDEQLQVFIKDSIKILNQEKAKVV